MRLALSAVPDPPDDVRRARQVRSYYRVPQGVAIVGSLGAEPGESGPEQTQCLEKLRIGNRLMARR